MTSLSESIGMVEKRFSQQSYQHVERRTNIPLLPNPHITAQLLWIIALLSLYAYSYLVMVQNPSDRLEFPLAALFAWLLCLCYRFLSISTCFFPDPCVELGWHPLRENFLLHFRWWLSHQKYLCVCVSLCVSEKHVYYAVCMCHWVCVNICVCLSTLIVIRCFLYQAAIWSMGSA